MGAPLNLNWLAPELTEEFLVFCRTSFRAGLSTLGTGASN